MLARLSHRHRRILSLALPIVGGLISQNVLNLVDTAMVGRLGPDALAAVGIASYANFMCISVVTGLSAGVQAMSARRLGEGRVSESAMPLNGGLFLSLLLGIPLAIAFYVLTPAAFPYLVDDPNVISEGTPYLRARLIALVAVGMNFSFRGYWNGVNRSAIYMRTLIVMHVSNVVLNYALIFGKFGAPELGTQGAGLGTTIATCIGTAYYIIQASGLARDNGFMRGVPRGESLRSLLQLAIPSAIQTFFFATGFTTMFWIIGRVGTDELAAASVLLNLTLVAILPGMGLGMTAASLVGQALGAGDVEDAKRWGWDVARVGFVVVGAIGIPLFLFGRPILGVFIDASEPAPIDLALWPLRIMAVTIGLDGIGMVLMQAHLGAGASRTVMVVSLATQWLVFMPIAYLVGPVLGWGLMGIWVAYIAYRMLQTTTFSVLWHRGKWQSIKV